MKNFLGIALIFLLIVVGGAFIFRRSENPTKPMYSPSTSTTTTQTMQIASPSFQNNIPIPKKYTCDGADINPPLTISNIPSSAQSLALIVSDPDAPNGEFIHWLVWDISPKTTEITEGITPPGAIVGKNDFGKKNYSGPCPQSGIHRYIFTLYALDTVLKLDSGAPKIDVQKTIAGHNISAPALIGTYTR